MLLDADSWHLCQQCEQPASTSDSLTMELECGLVKHLSCAEGFPGGGKAAARNGNLPLALVLARRKVPHHNLMLTDIEHDK